MTIIKWSPRALADIKRLYDFLNAKNHDAAKRAVGAIREGVNVLLEYPEIGKPVIDMSPNFRDLNIAFGSRGYIVRYYFNGKEAIILAIRHYLEVFKD